MIFILFIILLTFVSYSHSQETYINSVIGTPTKYIVKPGDRLFDIGVKFNTTARHIKRANALSGKDISPGDEIIIPSHRIVPKNIENGILINIPEMSLYYFKDGEIKYVFPVAVGKYRFQTPIGKFTVVYKAKNPTWIPPKWAGIEKPVPPGPQNPLGDRWIQLSKPGYGIHSTNAPSSIGMPISHGCIRMYPWDVKVLYDIVSIGTPVYIIYERAKVGYSLGKFYLEVYPDIYNLQPDEEILERLEKLGLSSVASAKQIEEITYEARGIPVAISGVDIVFNLLGEKKKPVMEIIDDSVWVDISSFVYALGGEADLLEERNLIELFFEGVIVQINLETGGVIYNGYNRGKINLKRVLNYNLVPVVDIARMFGYEVVVDLQKKEVNIF